MVAGSDVLQNNIAIVAAGTAGHILPSVEIAAKLEELGCQPYWLGDLKALKALSDRITLPSFELKSRSPRSLRRFFELSFYQGIISDLRLLWSLLSNKKVRVLLVTGGAAGVLPGLIALLRGIPLFIYEQNVVLGAANRLLKLLGAQQVFYGLPPLINNGKYVGQPLRADILGIKNAQKNSFPKKVLLIIGGSLGAGAFNTKLALTIAQIASLNSWAIRHLAGPNADLQATAANYGAHPDLQVLSYTDDMAELYAQASCVIARAGALTLSELHYLGLAAVLIPLPSAAGDHQRINAKAMAQYAPFTVLDESELNPSALEQMIYTSMELASHASKYDPFIYQHAAQEIALQCLKLSQVQ